MKLVISEKQLKAIISQLNVSQDLSEQGEGEGAPESGTSSDGEKKTGASKWESGVTRGPANQIGVTKWADSYKITRGKANPLSEQAAPPTSSTTSNRLSLFNLDRPVTGSDYFASVSAQNKRRVDMKMNVVPGKKHIYTANDGKNFFVNLISGNYPGAILDLREFLFEEEVMAVEIAVSIIFSETVVVPIAVGALNGVVLINDLYLWDYYGREYEGEAFARVLEDLLIIGSGGALALAGKISKVGLKRWLSNRDNVKTLINVRNNMGKIIGNIKNLIGGVKLPSGFKSWVSGKINKLEELPKIIDDLISKYNLPKVVSKMPKAAIVGLVGYVGIKSLNRLLGLNANSNEVNTNGENVLSGFRLTRDQMEYAISSQEDLQRYRNSGDWKGVAKKIAEINKNSRPCLLDLFNKGRFTVQLTSNKGDIYIINGKQYYNDRTGIYNVETNAEFTC